MEEIFVRNTIVCSIYNQKCNQLKAIKYSKIRYSENCIKTIDKITDIYADLAYKNFKFASSNIRKKIEKSIPEEFLDICLYHFDIFSTEIENVNIQSLCSDSKNYITSALSILYTGIVSLDNIIKGINKLYVDIENVNYTKDINKCILFYRYIIKDKKDLTIQDIYNLKIQDDFINQLLHDESKYSIYNPSMSASIITQPKSIAI